MLKAQKIDLEDTNAALIGSDLDRSVKKTAAETEEAWTKWDGFEKCRLHIWRIEKFKVVEWPSKQYGQFHRGDSYIVLNVYTVEDNEELLYNLHFWIGQESTADEFGTAAYKTVELDTLLDDKAIQYREVEGAESDIFRGYFPKDIEYLEGGSESGFTHVVAGTGLTGTRLYEFYEKDGKIQYRELFIPKWSDLHNKSVFILVHRDMIVKYTGSQARNGRTNYEATLFEKRQTSKQKYSVLDWIDSYHDEDDRTVQRNSVFIKALNEPGDDYDITLNERKEFVPKLLRIKSSKGSKELDVQLIAEGINDIVKIAESEKADVKPKGKKTAVNDEKKRKIDGNDVYVLDTRAMVSCWVGQNADKFERDGAMITVNAYIRDKQNKQAPSKQVKKREDFFSLLENVN